MPQRADAPPPPSVEVDVDKKYIVEVIDITEDQAQYDGAKEGEMSLTWKFGLTDMDGAIVVDANQGGDAYELWNFTNDMTFHNKKTGRKAKAREWTEALLGRELTDDQMNEIIDMGFADALRGKRGIADLEWYLTKKGSERLKIIRLRPIAKKGAPVAAESPEPVAVAAPAKNGKATKRTPEEIAALRAELGLDDT